MEAGQKVRLKQNPGKVGILTGKEKKLGGRLRLQVRFAESNEWCPERSLEIVESDDRPDVVDLLEKSRFGRAQDLRGALTHSRLSGRLADLIYSMHTTNTDFYPYQFKPVLNFLDSPCRGLLIADEVGLGKTIEAGLIWTELRARIDARRLLVLCPAMLREKWRDELALRFGIAAETCNAGELLDKLNRFRRGEIDEFVLVGSTQGLRPPRGWDSDETISNDRTKLASLLDSCALSESLFDAVIVDEAHYLRNPNSQTAALGHLLRNVTDHLVLLSATPIQLSSADLFHLLNLLDEDSFHYKQAFGDILQANEPILRLRDSILSQKINRAEAVQILQNAQSHPLLKSNRQLQLLIDSFPASQELKTTETRSQIAERLERINLLGRVVSRTRKSEVHEWRVVRTPVAEKVEMSSLERRVYDEVTACVRSYCEQYDLSQGFMLTIPQRQLSSSMPAAIRAWRKKLDQVTLEELAYESVGDDISTTTNTANTVGPLVSELMKITHNLGLGSFDDFKKHDSKYIKLIENLRQYWSDYPDKKVVLFSYYRGTLEYLEERLREDGVKPVRLVGGMKQSKYEIIEHFRTSDEVQILLSSEVASEGVDLQFSSLLINYDLPWNPMRVEQRIGRIDRLGQKEHRINIWNLFYKDTIDDRVYSRLLKRLDIFTRALGNMESVLGDSILHMTYDLLRHNLSKEQEKERIDQTAQAIANLSRQEERLEEEAAHLVAHGDYILNQVKAAQELNRFVSSQDLWVYFKDFFSEAYPGCQFSKVQDDVLLFEIELSTDAKVDLDHHLASLRLKGKTRLTGASGSKIRYLFENKTGLAKAGTEIVNQYHPVFRFISSSIRAGKTHYFPLVALQIASSKIPSVQKGQYQFVVQRWSVSGERDIEKLVFRAMPLAVGAQIMSPEEAEALVALTASEGSEWHGANNEIPNDVAEECYGLCLGALEDAEAQYRLQITSENDDRIDLQISTLKSHIAKQIATIQQVIDKYRDSEKQQMIPANLGRIRKLEEQRDTRLSQLEKKRNLALESHHVCSGVIDVL
ncbi:SNF2-related protein [Endozoicomonas sp. ALB115]|uniref:SNF2-related protein n=1 Tax=Endozoicomonas sp. ALB115 TaxID=3403074 RepID=UPI003BB55C74